MPELDHFQQEVDEYNRLFQELTARIYADGFVSCEEARDGTVYYREVRPRLHRFQRLVRRRMVTIHKHYALRLLLQWRPERRATLIEHGNGHLRAYAEKLHEFDKLLNDTSVMLKIFADVLQDCD
jgi:hypothetical protein